MKDRKESSPNVYHIQTLNPQDLQRAQEENNAEFERQSKTHIYTVEKTTEYPDGFGISYASHIEGHFPIGAKGMVKPGDRILVEKADAGRLSYIKGVYVLGQNLHELPENNPQQG